MVLPAEPADLARLVIVVVMGVCLGFAANLTRQALKEAPSQR
jgi:hypothetical protein